MGMGVGVDAVALKQRGINGFHGPVSSVEKLQKQKHFLLTRFSSVFLDHVAPFHSSNSHPVVPIPTVILGGFSAK